MTRFGTTRDSLPFQVFQFGLLLLATPSLCFEKFFFTRLDFCLFVSEYICGGSTFSSMALGKMLTLCMHLR